VAGAPGAVLAGLLLFLREPRAARSTRRVRPERPRSASRPRWRALAARRSYVVNTVSQVIYTFAMGGLATWMPTYFVRERGIPLGTAATTFGVILVVAGFLGTPHRRRLSGRLREALARGPLHRSSGITLVASIAFTLSLRCSRPFAGGEFWSDVRHPCSCS
jgi:hypothetical protein